MSRPFHQIIKRPVSSEKSYRDMGKLNKYTFECDPGATKIEIAKALEEAFPTITVLDVNTLNVRGKVRQRQRRGGARMIGQSPKRKKAIVTLAPGQKIEGLFEGI